MLTEAQIIQLLQDEPMEWRNNTNQQAIYGLVYEERRRLDQDKPATEDNIRTVKLDWLPMTPMEYKSAREAKASIHCVRPYDRVHVVNVKTFHEYHRFSQWTKEFVTYYPGERGNPQNV